MNRRPMRPARLVSRIYSILPTVTLSAVTMLSAFVISEKAGAQPLMRSVSSLEYVVSDSEFIAIGQVTEFRPSESMRGWHEATIAIEETIKGEESPNRIGVIAENSETLANWVDNEHRILIGGKWDDPILSHAFSLSGDKVVAARRDFTVLRDPGAIVAALKELTAQSDDDLVYGGFALTPPFDALRGSEWAEAYGAAGMSRLIVPVDRTLETQAYEMIQSADSTTRRDGVRALGLFRSERSIAALKGLLDDPALAFLRHAEYNLGVEIKVFDVRRTAFDTLRSWDIEVEEPTLHVETDRPGLVTLVVLDQEQIENGLLQKLERFENLSILYVNGTTVGDEELEFISTLKNLRELNLVETRVTNEGILQLANLPELRYVHLANTRVTVDGARALAAQCPHLEIDR